MNQLPLTSAVVRKQIDAMVRDIQYLSDPDNTDFRDQYVLDYQVRQNVVVDLTSATLQSIEGEIHEILLNIETRKETEELNKKVREKVDRAFGRAPMSTPKGVEKV